jgi:cytochrome c-type biogenesis protein CcmH/NrfG
LRREKSVGTAAIDSNIKAVQGSQMGLSSRTEGRAGNESERNNVATYVDANSEVEQDSQMETSTDGNIVKWNTEQNRKTRNLKGQICMQE